MTTSSIDKRPVTELAGDVITSFTSSIKGDVILPRDPSYNDARKVYNAMINKHPGIPLGLLIRKDALRLE